MTRLVTPLSAAERTGFLECARSKLGTPFRHRGRSERGLDCVGLVGVCLQSVGREIADRPHYGRDPVADGLRDVLVAHFGDPVTDWQAGDVVLMRWHQDNGTDLFNHVAILADYYLGGFALIHALKEANRVIETRLAGPWPRRIVEAWRP
jgi:cell wall-associated NlpC family hydrolase